MRGRAETGQGGRGFGAGCRYKQLLLSVATLETFIAMENAMRDVIRPPVKCVMCRDGQQQLIIPSSLGGPSKALKCDRWKTGTWPRLPIWR